MNKGTTPGINQQVRLDHFTQDERKIIRELSKEWYITNGGSEISLGPTSTYRYIVMKPTDAFRHMFNLEREIITVFSPYTIFEPRTLDAISRAKERYQSLRLERICSILISKDADIEGKLSSLLKNDQESQVVVPFSYKELLSNEDPYFVKNRFRSHFYTRDLFAFEAPLRSDLYFFGMNDAVHQITNRHKTGENSALFGLRRTGKTSIIFGIRRALDRQGDKSVFIDCQNTAFHQRRWNEALFYIIDETKRQHQLNLRTAAEESYTEKNAAIHFERDLMAVYHALGGKNILLIFDEIENITFKISPSEHWAKENDFIFFWQSLRSLFQKLDRIFSFLIVGTNSMCVEIPHIHGKDNPIFNQVPFSYIPRFDVPQTREMVSTLGGMMGLRFDEIIYSKLTEDYGGHPFLIRHVCSVVNNICTTSRPSRVDKITYARAKEFFNKNQVNYIEMIITVLKEFYSDEYEMMGLLAENDLETFNMYAANSPQYTSHLLGYGIIEEHAGDFAFRIEAVRDYLQEKRKFKRLNLSQPEMWAEISERRNRLEPRLRMLVRNLMQVSYGKPEAKDLVLGILGDSRKSDYRSHAYEDLFDASKSIIFFEDLRKIIIKYWDTFKNVFQKDKDDFDRKIKAVNALRADAHAKEIDAEQMAYFRICIGAIETQLDAFQS